MKEIPLTNSSIPALVDDEDYHWLSRFTWFVNAHGYVASGDNVLMHRLVVGASKRESYVDHRDGNPFHNYKLNIRKGTSAQNQMNADRRADNTTGFKGVGKRNGKFIARIQAEGKRIHIGQYDTAEEAAKAYDEAAINYFGEWASLNFK